MENMEHMEFLQQVAENDVEELKRKEKTYQGSWKRRGGVGAAMMMLRKIDRLEVILKECNYDIFHAIRQDTNGMDGSALAELRDLRRYCLLIESEMIAQQLDDPIKKDGPFVLERLQDGLRLVDIPLNQRDFYMVAPANGRGYNLVDRRKAPEGTWEHLARLRVELNNKEYEEMLPEYQCLFGWNGDKWLMRPEYKERWAKE